MSEENQSRYIIVGVSVNNDPIGTVNDGMSAVQGAVEALLLQGYRPVGGLAMCCDNQGRPHLAQAMLRDQDYSLFMNPIGAPHS